MSISDSQNLDRVVVIPKIVGKNLEPGDGMCDLFQGLHP